MECGGIGTEWKSVISGLGNMSEIFFVFRHFVTLQSLENFLH